VNETCFVCGAPALRRELITTARSSVHHSHRNDSHLDSASTRELKPLCAKCIADEEATAREMLKGAKIGLAIGGTMFAASFLLPILLCLGSAFVLGVIAWFSTKQ
jgi:hypothetical protein